MDLLLNGLIFGVTLVLVLGFFRKEGQWTGQRARRAFCFFTVQSNVFCAGAALLMCVLPDSPWIWTLKYMGTVAVTVTMMTVLLYLGPTIGYRKMFTGSDLYMHLVTPLLALVSFCGFERQGMRFGTSLLGLVPVVLYAALYLYKVIVAPQSRRWEDVYGFNRSGRWPLALAVMLLGCFLICMLLYWVQNA